MQHKNVNYNVLRLIIIFERRLTCSGITNVSVLEDGNVSISTPLQTIHMPDYDPDFSASKASGIIFKDMLDKIVHYAWWDPKIETKGYRIFNAFDNVTKTDLPLQDFDFIECNKIPVYNVDPNDFPFLKLKISIFSGWFSTLIYEDTIDLNTSSNGFKYSFDDFKIPWNEYKQNPLPDKSKFKNSMSGQDKYFKLIISIAKSSTPSVDIGSFSLQFQIK